MINLSKSSLTCALAVGWLVAAPPAQSIARSWQVQPAGTAFVGGLAYDPIADHVWTVDSTNDLIQEHARDGRLLQSFAAVVPPGSGAGDPMPIGAAVDPVTGNLWIADENEYVYELRPNGAPTGRSWSTQPAVRDASAIALDPRSRTLYVADDSAQLIAEFDAGGRLVRSFSVFGAGSGDPDGLAYDPVKETFFLGEDNGDFLIEVDRNGAFVRRYTLAFLGISPEALALDTRTGVLFIGDGFVTGKVFEVLGVAAKPNGKVTAYGQGCPDSGGTIPRLQVSDVASVARPFDAAVQTSIPATSPAQTVFLFGTVRANIGLAFVGAPSCALLTNPVLATITVAINSNRRAGLPLGIPNNSRLAGVTLTLQTANFPDTGVPGQLSVSNAVELEIQLR